MTNKSGKSAQHGLVGNIRPKSAMSKRNNKAKARARKAEAVEEFQGLMKGV